MSSLKEAEQDIKSSPERSSKPQQELKVEAASCQDELENKDKVEDSEEFCTTLSVGDGHYLVDLGSSSEFVVDEACILELFRCCRQCSRHCKVRKRVHGLKIFVTQTCCFCEKRFEWTNLPDDFGDEDARDDGDNNENYVEGQMPANVTAS